MADYIVTSGELTTVANAIREKNGTSSNLSWPNGFVSGISSGGGGETWNTVFEGSVTTEENNGAYIGRITKTRLSAGSIKVTFNGTEYTCNKLTLDAGAVGYGGIGEGGPDFTNYPFALVCASGVNYLELYTQTAGTYSLKIEEPQSGGSSDFSTAQVTVATTVRLGSTYRMNYSPVGGDNLISAIINDDGSLSTDNDDQIVTVNNPNIYNILFTKNGYVTIFFVATGPIIVEGNGEVLTETIEGTEVTYVRAYGECTITKTTTEP